MPDDLRADSRPRASIDIHGSRCDNASGDTGNRGREIAYKIIREKCAAVPWLCGDCRPECPNQAISTGHVIDPGRCTECVGAHGSPRCAEICSAEACVPDPEHRESRYELLEKWRRLHPDEEPALGTF